MGIKGTLTFARRQIVGFLTNTAEQAHRFLTISIEVLIARLALAKAHVLYEGNKDLYLVVAALFHLHQMSASLLVIHLGYGYESQVVVRLSITCRIVIGKPQSPMCQNLGRIEITVMISIRKRIQLIYFALMRRRTS